MDNKKPSINQQDYPHAEGQQDNIAPQGQGAGRRESENNSQQLSDMGDDSEVQRSGRPDAQNDEGRAQQNERQA